MREWECSPEFYEHVGGLVRNKLMAAHYGADTQSLWRDQHDNRRDCTLPVDMNTFVQNHCRLYEEGRTNSKVSVRVEVHSMWDANLDQTFECLIYLDGNMLHAQKAQEHADPRVIEDRQARRILKITAAASLLIAWCLKEVGVYIDELRSSVRQHIRANQSRGNTSP